MSDPAALRAVIQLYFNDQRRAAIIGGVLSLIILAAVAWMLSRGNHFLHGLGIVLGLAALLIGGSGLSLAVRDGRRIETLMKAHEPVIAAEIARMSAVVANYKYYRTGFTLMAAFGALILLFTAGAAMNGVAVGLLLVAALGLTIDHFDRAGAAAYLRALLAHRTRAEPAPT